jgi:hypothetical protein
LRRKVVHLLKNFCAGCGHSIINLRLLVKSCLLRKNTKARTSKKAS